MTEQGKRITLKRTRPNPLFQDWLEELYEEAKNTKSKLEPMLEEALDSISKYPLPLQTGAECAILKGFRKKLCMFLDMRLEIYRSNNADSTAHNLEVIQASDTSESNNHEVLAVNNNSRSNNSNDSSDETQDQPVAITGTDKDVLTELPSVNTHSDLNHANPAISGNKYKNKNKKAYKPSHRSGGYAILIGLLEHYQENPGKSSLTKEDLIERAQKHSEESFVRPKPESFYTAWSSMSKLITKGLVQKTRNKKVEYKLTDEGMVLAHELVKESASIPSMNDLIFNNDLVSESVGSNSQTNSSHEENVMNNGHKEFIEMSAGSFDIILLIDKNETGGVSKKNDPTVAEFKKYPDLKHEYRSLKVGDFTWIARHKVTQGLELVLPYVVERKRMDDLGASIKDGRFHEQKFRLRRCGLKHVFYLVENYGKNKHVGLPMQSLLQALSNTRVQDGFKVHMTNSLNNSARFLAMMTKRLTIEYKDKNLKGCNEEPEHEELMTFKYFNITSAKSKPLTVTETFIKLLLQLKGVSVEKAVAITNAYGTPSLLIQKYKECNQKDGEILLANLKYGELNRNVGTIVSKSIYQLFSDKFKC